MGVADRYNNADASFYLREVAAINVARMDSSIVYGNHADVMKNTTVPSSSTEIIRLIPLTVSREVHIQSLKQ